MTQTAPHASTAPAANGPGAAQCLALRAEAGAEDVIRSYRLGCNSYIRKPIDSEGFLKAVQPLTVYWLALSEPPPRRAAQAL